MNETKIYLKVCIGDCEFNDEFTLEFVDVDKANKIKTLIDENCNNIVFTEISKKEKGL